LRFDAIQRGSSVPTIAPSPFARLGLPPFVGQLVLQAGLLLKELFERRPGLACASIAGKVTYICGFAATGGGATAAAVVNLTVTNIVIGTMTYTFGANTGAGVPSAPLVVPFNPCIPAGAVLTPTDLS
jgi:hypothetical protein